MKRVHAVCFILGCLGLMTMLSDATPVLEWKFDGGSADDSSGNGYHGTVTEGTNGSVGFVDGTIEFSNAKDRVVSPDITLSGAFTVGGWIKVEEGFAGSWNRFLCTDDHKTGFFIGQGADSGQWKFAVNNDFDLPLGGTLAPGRWQHVMGTFDGINVARLYVDGVKVSTTTTMSAPSIASQPFVLGKDMLEWNNGFPGRFDDIRVYDRALTEAEVEALLPDISPADHARGIDADVALSWQAPPATHYAVYFGDDYDSVRAADTNDTGGIYKGMQHSPSNSTATLTYAPGTLEDGKTYYWRLDQQDDADPGSCRIGHVWTFTVGHAKYRFNGSMSRETTEAYLAKSMTWGINHNPTQFDEDLRCILNVGAKFIGRTATPWDMVNRPGIPNIADDDYYFDRMAYYADRIHEKDSEIILQGCIFEAVCSAYDTGLSSGTRVRPGVEDIPVPAWVFEEFNQPVVQRNFSYQDMIYEDTLFGDGFKNDYWQPGVSVQDITRLETQMWTYYRARRFIDAGFESIHFGQTDHNYISHDDADRSTLYDVLGRIRSYALQNARRGFVLCDAHDGHGVVQNGQLLYDIHVAPARPQEQCGTPYEAILEFGHSLYGRSAGGTTPSGWYCDSLPYNIEIDNFEIVYWEYVGTCGNLPDTFWVWGWDEMSWYAHCSESYRNDWLEYAVDWLKTNDPNGYLRMPGLRRLEDGAFDPEGVWKNVYRPNSRPHGFNQEETIKRIFKELDSPASPTGLGAVAGVSQVSLDWDDNGESDLIGYNIYRSTTAGSYGAALASDVTSSDYVDHTAVNGTTYYYVVTAVNTSNNESIQSDEVSATAGEALLLEWKFDGGNADDSSGNSYHGTVTEGTNGSVGFVYGTIGFSNTKDRVVSPNVTLAGAFTVGGWIKVEEGFSGSWNRFMCTDDHKTGFFIGQDADSGQWKFAVNNDWDLPKAGSIVPGQWQHVMGTYDGSHVARLYVDGAEVSSTTAMDAPSVTSQPFVLGKDKLAHNNGFPGQYDLIQVYDKVLSAAEIAVLFGSTPKSPYEHWSSIYNLSSEDDDFDGLSNLSEFALGGNPTNPSENGYVPVIGATGSSFYYVYPRRIDAALLYWLETTTNLVSGTWTNAGYVQLPGAGSFGSGFDAVTNEVPAVFDSTFIRLRVQEE